MRWLPYDGTAAAKAIMLARALQAGRFSAPGSARRARIAAAALPVYKALLVPQMGGNALRLAVSCSPSAPADPGQVQPDRVAAEVMLDRPRLAATLRGLTRERAECERALARGGLSAWRAETLASQAEALSNEIMTLDRLLRMDRLD